MDLVSEKWEKLFSEYQEDCEMLKKLLYRNHNQHSNTLLFRYLQKIKRLVNEIDQYKLRVLRSAIIECSRLDSNRKFSVTITERVVATKNLLLLFIENATKSIHYCSKAATTIADLLKRRSFATLYSALLALISSVFEFSVSMLKLTLSPSYHSVESLLSMITIVSSNKAIKQLGMQAKALKMPIESEMIINRVMKRNKEQTKAGSKINDIDLNLSLLRTEEMEYEEEDDAVTANHLVKERLNDNNNNDNNNNGQYDESAKHHMKVAFKVADDVDHDDDDDGLPVFVTHKDTTNSAVKTTRVAVNHAKTSQLIPHTPQQYQQNKNKKEMKKKAKRKVTDLLDDDVLNITVDDDDDDDDDDNNNNTMTMMIDDTVAPTIRANTKTMTNTRSAANTNTNTTNTYIKNNQSNSIDEVPKKKKKKSIDVIDDIFSLLS
jgi:hypothetical protein